MKRISLYDPFTGKENIDHDEKLKFLVSPAYCMMLRKMVVGLTSDHRLTVNILPPDHPELAYTDGSRVDINTLHQLFINEPIEKITEFCLALAVHESLHPLYSCFQCVQDAATQKAGETDNFVYVRKEILNILEDARIERIGAFKFPGVSYAIDSLNEFMFQHEIDISQKKDIEILMQWLLDFVSVGKNRHELEGELGALFERIKPVALLAKYSDTCSGCYFYTKKIMKMIKSIIPENEPLQSQNFKPSTAQTNTVDVNAGTGQTSPGVNGQGIGNGQCQNQAQGQDQQGQNQASGQGNNGQSQGGQGLQGNPGGPGGKGQGQLSQMLTQALNSSYNQHVKEKANTKKDSKTATALSGDSTNTYKIVPVRGTYNEMDEYAVIKSELTPIINNLKKGLKNVINYNVDEMSRYLHVGRINPKSLSRIPSGAVCAKRIEKSDEADLNITILVDLSGSMSGSALYNSIRTCIVLQEVSMALNIPISVLGFQNGSNRTKIYHFSNRMFKSQFSHTAIIRMNASGGTPLNPALLYLPTLLQKQKEEDKLVIVITDGQPNEPVEECALSVRKLSKYGKVYGLSIGDGREALEGIFGANCIAVDSLDKLPRELCRIVEKNLLRR